MKKNINLATQAGIEVETNLRLVIHHLEEALGDIVATTGDESLPEKIEMQIRLLHAKTALSYLNIALN